MGNDDDVDAEFSAIEFDDEVKEKNILKCSSCGKDYCDTGSEVDFLCMGMCESCSESMKENLKKMETGDPLSSVEQTVRSTSSDGCDGDGADDNDIVNPSGGDDDKGDGSDDKDGFTKDPLDDISKPLSSSAAISSSEEAAEDMTFDIMIAAVLSSGATHGRVTIHDNEYEFSACPKSVSGRGGGTTMIITDYSKAIPDLFGYYYYGGMYTKSFCAMAFTMTECGNLFMGVMETMCNRCRVDPVIYFADTNTCRIIYNERTWRKQFKLNSILRLKIDIEKAKRYVTYVIFSCL